MPQTSDNMPTDAERTDLKNKLQEVRTMVADMEVRLNALPYRRETEEMHCVMSKMVVELHRMERNLAAMLEIDDENGGHADGDY